MSNFVKFIKGTVAIFAICLLVSADMANAGNISELSPPAISYIVEGVERNGTFTVFGEGLTPGTTAWLWHPESASRNVQDMRRQSQLELQKIAVSFLDNQELPKQLPEDAQVAGFLTDTDNPQVAMVCREASSEPARDGGEILPTVLWIGNDAGFSNPYMVNAPQLWFPSDLTVVPGQQMRLFGINLSGRGYNQTLIAMQNQENEKIYWGRLLLRFNQEHANVRQHELSFRIPDDIPNGIYSVRIYRFDGGPYGWSNKLDIKILQKRHFVDQMGFADQSSNATPGDEHYPDPPAIFPITNASGDGITDNTMAIQSVLDKASSAGGGVVLLPSGVYAVSQSIEIPENVVLQGAGTGATSITVSQIRPLINEDLKSKGQPLIHMRTNTGLQDISVIAGPGVDVNVLVDDPPLVENVFIRRVKIENIHEFVKDIEDGAWGIVDFGIYVKTSSRGFHLLDSYIKAPLTFRMEGRPQQRHSYARISGNHFETYPHHQQDNVFLLSLSESIFENNILAYGHRAFTSQLGMWRNFIADNQVIDIRGVGNGSELFMSEYGSVIYHGPILSDGNESSNLRVPDNTDKRITDMIESAYTERELYAFVASGKGFGQYRKLTLKHNNTLTIDQPWCVLPDKESTIYILEATVQNLFLNNATIGGRGVYAFFYGSAINNIISGNEASAGGVTSIWLSAVANKDRLALVAFNSLVNNRLVQNSSLNLAALTGGLNDSGEKLLIGNRIIRNQIFKPGEYGSPNQYYAYWNWLGGWNAGHGWVEPGIERGIGIWNGSYNVIENNYVVGAETGIFIGDGKGVNASDAPIKGNVVRWNRVDQSQTPVTEQGTSTYVQPPSYQRY